MCPTFSANLVSRLKRAGLIQLSLLDGSFAFFSSVYMPSPPLRYTAAAQSHSSFFHNSLWYMTSHVHNVECEFGLKAKKSRLDIGKEEKFFPPLHRRSSELFALLSKFSLMYDKPYYFLTISSTQCLFCVLTLVPERLNDGFIYIRPFAFLILIFMTTTAQSRLVTKLV